MYVLAPQEIRKGGNTDNVLLRTRARKPIDFLFVCLHVGTPLTNQTF